MSRKDLVEIATHLRLKRPDEIARRQGWELAVMGVADALDDLMGLDVNGNRRFDPDRFYAACGFGS